MAYRKLLKGSPKFNERLERTRQTRLQNRLRLPAPGYPPVVPDLRRRIIVEDYDGGETVRHEILLYKSNRIDVYKIFVHGQPLPKNLGWARVLELIRKAFLRLSSPRSIAGILF